MILNSTGFAKKILGRDKTTKVRLTLEFPRLGEEMVNAPASGRSKGGTFERRKPVLEIVQAKEENVAEAIKKIHILQEGTGGETQYLVTLVGGQKIVRVSPLLVSL